MGKFLFPIVYGGIMTVLICLMTPFLFEKLIQAEVELPFFLLCVFGLISGVLVLAMIVKGRKKRWIILTAVLLFLSQSIVSISLCKVNSIRFADVAESLIRVVTGKSGVENRDSEMDYVKKIEVFDSETSPADSWTVGFGSAQIIPDHLRTDPLYIVRLRQGITPCSCPEQ